MGPRSYVLVLGLAVLSLLPKGAQAYVREVTKSGVPVAWRYPCVTMQIYLGSAPPVVTADAFFAASAQAAGVWSYPTLACTDIRLAMVAEAQASADVGHDTQNVIMFRQDTWCRQPTPVDDAGTPQPDCYPSSALAITSIFKNSKTGEILDADIEFNAVDYSWGDLEGQRALATSNTADFQNALTHELGHVLGLDHNCFTANDAQARLNDNTGAPEVDCNSTLPDTILNATMYPSVVLIDTQRRTLSLDDEQGVCDIYPHLHEVCPVRPSDSGCSVLTMAPSHRTRTALLCTTLGLLVAALAFLRKRLRV
ncbi:MAG TPA: hypothetical protein VF550_16645 [Polyangia bacterium]